MAKGIEPDALQWCSATGAEATDKPKHRRFPLNLRRYFFTV